METKKYNSFFANVLLADFEIVELHKKLKILIADNKMETKQTAIDWLFEKITQNEEIRWRGTQYRELFEQAKQMEKKQIVEAFYEGMKTNTFDPNRGRGAMYYNEQYGQGSPDTSPNTQNK